jgi:glycosyltransferase involved in cell wall biosynthesis
MKVLFNSPNPGLHGGPPTHLPLLEQELRKHVQIESFHYGRRTDSETLMDKFFGRFRDLYLLHRRTRSVRPDIIHHNSAFDSRAILRDAPLVQLAKHHMVPIFIKVHGSHREAFGRMNLFMRLLRRSLLANVSGIGVLSEAERLEFVDNWPSLRSKVVVVKNVINPHFFQVARDESPTPTVLFVSRFIRQKGMFDLLEAIPLILKDIPTAKFIFVGSGRDARDFLDQVRSRNLGGAVNWIEHVSNEVTVQYYSSAWVLVFPSHFPEGMPMVVAEAMASGLPIVTTKTRFSTSYMIEGKHCLYTEIKDPRSIALEVLSLLKQKDLRDTLSQHSRTLAEEFTAPKVAGEFIRVYNRLLDSTEPLV